MLFLPYACPSVCSLLSVCVSVEGAHGQRLLDRQLQLLFRLAARAQSPHLDLPQRERPGLGGSRQPRVAPPCLGRGPVEGPLRQKVARPKRSTTREGKFIAQPRISALTRRRLRRVLGGQRTSAPAKPLPHRMRSFVSAQFFDSSKSVSPSCWRRSVTSEAGRTYSSTESGWTTTGALARTLASSLWLGMSRRCAAVSTTMKKSSPAPSMLP